MGLTEKLARHVVDLDFDKLPRTVVTATKRIFLDLLGTTLAGSSAQGCRIVVDTAKTWGGKKESTIIAYGGKVPAQMASLCNGTMGHALDFDDTHDLAVLHTSTCVVPAALAVAEKAETSGKEFITAIALGMDIHCRMGAAAEETITTTGWIYTATMGIFGAALAAGKILGLDKEKLLNAIGISYSSASGNMQSVIEGALTKRLQAGLSAMGGVLAASLAQKGFTGPKHALEGEYGFYAVYQDGKYNPRKLTEGLGSRFEILNLSLKPYPCCRHAHSSIDAILEAQHKYNINLADLENIEIGVNRSAYSAVCEPSELKHKPLTPVDAQFSIPYVVACALTQKRVTIEDFTDEAIKRRSIMEVVRKVKPYVDTEIERNSHRRITPAKLKIKMKDGRSHTVFVNVPKGDPANPMTKEEANEKFRSCCRHAVRRLGNKRVEEIIRLVDNIEDVENINELTELLA